MLHAWSRRAHQVARAKLLHRANDRAISATTYHAWTCYFHSTKMSKRASRLVSCWHLVCWLCVTVQRRHAKKLLLANRKRTAHLLLRTWCRYTQRVMAAHELARGIKLVENTRLFKLWSRYTLAWQPVRHFRTNLTTVQQSRGRSHGCHSLCHGCQHRGSLC